MYFSFLQRIWTGSEIHSALSSEVKRPWHEADYSYLVPRLRISGAMFPVTHMISWHEK